MVSLDRWSSGRDRGGEGRWGMMTHPSQTHFYALGCVGSSSNALRGVPERRVFFKRCFQTIRVYRHTRGYRMIRDFSFSKFDGFEI